MEKFTNKSFDKVCLMKGFPDHFFDVEELLSFAREEGLYPDLKAQLKKDFQRANIEFTFTFHPSYPKPEIKQLSEWMQEKLYHLLMERFKEYLNLMYAVDIPEWDFRGVKAEDTVEASIQISFLVLKRELKKVWFRRNYES